MEQEKHFRHELKFAISYSEYLSIRNRIKLVMKPDTHVGAEGTYQIRSVYFDNADDKALMEKVDGVAKREKFRIRFYNDDLSYITLEKKMKINNLCLKYDTPITKEEFEGILNGNLDWMKDHSSELVRELYAKMQYQRLLPKVLVSYVREPYVFDAGNVRVTFDSCIRTSVFSQDFMQKDFCDISATDEPQDMLLEVKYDEFLPEIIQTMIQCKNNRQQSFSKYEACRRFG